MTALRIVLQVRTSSARLPAKALLPVAGVPAAVLAARRAASAGAEVVVATSDDAGDDVLAGLLTDAGLRVHRGSLDDPLTRFVGAARDLPDDAVVVRMTADNVVPDGALVGEVVAALHRSGAGYVRTDPPTDGLPYGVSVEAFSAGALRGADAAARPGPDREHVTPWIRRQHGEALFHDHAGAGWGHLRCTIDTLEDYLRVSALFTGVPDPVAVGWRQLCARLAALPGAPRAAVPARVVAGVRQSVLSLGTAQLGLTGYGRANTTGAPDDAEALAMLQAAAAAGVTHLDTARAYGTSEARLGRLLAGGLRQRFALVTKLRPLAAGGAADGTRGAGAADGTGGAGGSVAADGAGGSWAAAGLAAEAAEASLFRSLTALATARVEVLLLHRAADRRLAGGAAWDRLAALAEAGHIGRLGVSVQDPAELLDAVGDPLVRYVQLPVNMLDRRWAADEVQQALAARADVVVAGRSALLQGVLTLTDPAAWPAGTGADPAALVAALAKATDELGRRDVVDLALAYVRGLPWLHTVVAGAETAVQLSDTLGLMATAPLTPDECAHVEDLVPAGPLGLVDPSRWPAP